MEPEINPDAYVLAKAAARILGVKLPTLYAYASRGLVRSIASPGSKARRYVRSDLERLRTRSQARSGHGPVAAGALRWGEPVLDSAISFIGPQGPRYRGVPALELAQSGRSFETVAELLWTGTAVQDTPPWPTSWPLGPPERLSRLLGPDPSPIRGPFLALPLLAGADPGRLGANLAAELDRARRLMMWLAASFGLPLKEGNVPRALEQRRLSRVFAVALGANAPRAASALESALILCADHELNASTFAARIAASAGADLYACVTAALATLSGPRHGGLSDRVEALVDEVASPERAARIVQERLRRGDGLPGFGHRLYPGGDPRGSALLALAERQLHSPRVEREARTVLALARAVEVLGGEKPTLDLGLVALAAALRLPRGSAVAIFAMGRAAGWIAHVLEQRADPNLLRPRARYVGQDVP